MDDDHPLSIRLLSVTYPFAIPSFIYPFSVFFFIHQLLKMHVYSLLINYNCYFTPYDNNKWIDLQIRVSQKRHPWWKWGWKMKYIAFSTFWEALYRLFQNKRIIFMYRTCVFASEHTEGSKLGGQSGVWDENQATLRGGNIISRQNRQARRRPTAIEAGTGRPEANLRGRNSWFLAAKPGPAQYPSIPWSFNSKNWQTSRVISLRATFLKCQSRFIDSHFQKERTKEQLKFLWANCYHLWVYYLYRHLLSWNIVNNLLECRTLTLLYEFLKKLGRLIIDWFLLILCLLQ